MKNRKNATLGSYIYDELKPLYHYSLLPVINTINFRRALNSERGNNYNEKWYQDFNSSP